jgi:hypothetical protein
MTPELETVLQNQWTHVEWVRNAVIFGIPALAIFTPLRLWGLRNPLLRLILAVVLTWPFYSYFELHYVWPLASKLAQLRNMPPPDGPNTVGPVIAIGWLIMLLIGALMIGVRIVLSKTVPERYSAFFR